MSTDPTGAASALVVLSPASSKLRPLPRPILVRHLRLPSTQERSLDWQAPPAGLLDQLCARGLVAEALRMLAYALPEREAVWWGCMCVAHTAGRCAMVEREALDAAEAWVWDPKEAAGRQAAWAAVAAGYDAPGAWPALAAYWSQQSDGQPDAQPGRCGRGVETATKLAARRGDPDSGQDNVPAAVLRRFVESGQDIAGGGSGRLPPAVDPAIPST